MRSSSRCPVLLGCVLLTLFTLYALGAGAQPASDVILLLHVQLADGGWPEAEQRARAELEADGFTIVVVESPPTHRLDAELPNLVRAQGAIAALRIARARDATEGPLTIYLLDRVTGKTSTRWIDPQQPDLTSGRVGLLAVELLHASLIELTLANQSLGEVEPTPAVQRVVARELEPEPRFPRPLLRFGPGLLLTRGGHGVVGGVAVAGGLQLTRLAGVELDGFTTVVPSQVEGRPGSAEVFFHGLRVHALLRPALSRTSSLLVGAGAGALGVRAVPTPAAGYRSVGAAWGGVGIASSVVGVAWGLTPDLDLVAVTHLGVPLDRLELVFAGVPVASLDMPLLDAGLALEWTPVR